MASFWQQGSFSGTRLWMVLSLTICLASAPQIAAAQSVALTFDDGPNLAETPRLSATQRNQAMLAALAKHGLKSALFVTTGFGADTPAGYALAKAWGDAGHAIGNHTVNHPDLNSVSVSLAHYQQDIMACDKIISSLPGYQKWFRYTYLREGNTPEKRDGMRKFLREQQYRNAYVSLDTSDWRFNEKLLEVLKRDSQADISEIKLAYLAHIKQRALAYRDLSFKLQGRDIPQVLLLHHNLVNALWLDDVITQFKEMGWTFVTPALAFADPVYQLFPDRPAAGQSLLLSLAKTLGLGKFDGWLRLHDDGDFEMEALKQKGL
nr:polysaccharide deacetylase family protein [uncultured Undibacterium sp.]